MLLGLDLGQLPAVTKRDCECDGGFWNEEMGGCIYPMRIMESERTTRGRYNPETGKCETVGRLTHGGWPTPVPKPKPPLKDVPGTNGTVVQETVPRWVWYAGAGLGGILVLDLIISRTLR